VAPAAAGRLVHPRVGGAVPPQRRKGALLLGVLRRRDHHPLAVGLHRVAAALGLKVGAAVGGRRGDRGDAAGGLVALELVDVKTGLALVAADGDAEHCEGGRGGGDVAALDVMTGCGLKGWGAVGGGLGA